MSKDIYQEDLYSIQNTYFNECNKILMRKNLDLNHNELMLRKKPSQRINELDDKIMLYKYNNEYYKLIDKLIDNRIKLRLKRIRFVIKQYSMSKIQINFIEIPLEIVANYKQLFLIKPITKIIYSLLNDELVEYLLNYKLTTMPEKLENELVSKEDLHVRNTEINYYELFLIHDKIMNMDVIVEKVEKHLIIEKINTYTDVFKNISRKTLMDLHGICRFLHGIIVRHKYNIIKLLTYNEIISIDKKSNIDNIPYLKDIFFTIDRVNDSHDRNDIQDSIISSNYILSTVL